MNKKIEELKDKIKKGSLMFFNKYQYCVIVLENPTIYKSGIQRGYKFKIFNLKRNEYTEYCITPGNIGHYNKIKII